MDQCAPILKAYLQRASGTRPHIPVHKDAPLAEFVKVASDFPVFRVLVLKTPQLMKCHIPHHCRCLLEPCLAVSYGIGVGFGAIEAPRLQVGFYHQKSAGVGSERGS
jgi:hypothetical protein